MTKSSSTPQWVYVIIQEPGSNEAFLGQYDEEKDISFIPVFETKEAAENCLPMIHRDPKLTYEIHAILHETVIDQAEKNGFTVYLLDQDGVPV